MLLLPQAPERTDVASLDVRCHEDPILIIDLGKETEGGITADEQAAAAKEGDNSLANC
jgi:hypothetical protein